MFITSYDGLKLCAHIYSRGEYGGRVVLCMHGYNSGAVNDFAGAVDFFTDNGFTVILADQRAHGKVRADALPSAQRSVLTAARGANTLSGGTAVT